MSSFGGAGLTTILIGDGSRDVRCARGMALYEGRLWLLRRSVSFLVFSFYPTPHSSPRLNDQKWEGSRTVVLNGLELFSSKDCFA